MRAQPLTNSFIDNDCNGKIGRVYDVTLREHFLGFTMLQQMKNKVSMGWDDKQSMLLKRCRAGTGLTKCREEGRERAKKSRSRKDSRA